jgi:hypothetical protein
MTTKGTTMLANKVIVVGMLDTMLVRDQNARRSEGRKLIEVTRREGRDRGTGGRWQRMAFQVGSPYGGTFALPIEIAPHVPGAELLSDAAPETLFAIEGTLQLVQTFDGRFASDRVDQRGRSDRGRPTRELQILTARVREPSEAERDAASGVWLEGEVAEPPQISRHTELPAIQLAGTILRVAFARPAAFPGLGGTIQEVAEVNVAIPSTHPDAAYLFRAGNRVRVQGQLDCRMEFQGGDSVRAKLAEIDAEWAERKQALAGQAAELRRAEAQYRRTRQRYEAAPRLFVMVGLVELLEGEPLPLAETYEARRAFVRGRRQQQAERRARAADDRERRRSAATSHTDAEVAIADMSILATVDVGTHPEAGATRPIRPRKRVVEAESVEGGERLPDEPLGVLNGNTARDNEG